MPIILAAMDAMSTEAGRGMIHPVILSVGTFAPALVVNGPIAKELNINSSFGLLGPGWKANAAIGRTINLLITNLMGSYPVLSSQSLPGRYTWCFAENESESPWEPLNVELGLGAGVNNI